MKQVLKKLTKKEIDDLHINFPGIDRNTIPEKDVYFWVDANHQKYIVYSYILNKETFFWANVKANQNDIWYKVISVDSNCEIKGNMHLTKSIGNGLNYKRESINFGIC